MNNVTFLSQWEHTRNMCTLDDNIKTHLTEPQCKDWI